MAINIENVVSRNPRLFWIASALPIAATTAFGVLAPDDVLGSTANSATTLPGTIDLIKIRLEETLPSVAKDVCRAQAMAPRDMLRTSKDME